MKRILSIAFVLSMLSLACGGMKLQVSNPALTQEIGIDRDKTVILAKKSLEGEYRGYCSGVWISESQVLTAYHCVRDKKNEIEGQELGNVVEIAYYQDLETGKGEPSIKEVHGGVVAKIAPEVDLALLTIDVALAQTSGPHTHRFALISQRDIQDGESVIIVGHPIGLYYTWLPGTIVTSMSMKNPHDNLVKLLYITSSAWFGNSGGAAFDLDGNVVGICSFLMRGPQMTFFIHRDEIVKFLLRGGPEGVSSAGSK